MHGLAMMGGEGGEKAFLCFNRVPITTENIFVLELQQVPVQIDVLL